VKPHDGDHQKKGERNNHKIVSEVYLTRLLTTKVTHFTDNAMSNNPCEHYF